MFDYRNKGESFNSNELLNARALLACDILSLPSTLYEMHCERPFLQLQGKASHGGNTTAVQMLLIVKQHYVLNVPFVLGISPSRPATLLVACLIATASALKADSAL